MQPALVNKDDQRVRLCWCKIRIAPSLLVLCLSFVCQKVGVRFIVSLHFQLSCPALSNTYIPTK